MTYGLPKTGKSTLMLEFAGYLPRQFGKVLWVELEEDLFTSFKEKVDRLNVGHPDFHAQRNLPRNLSEYDFVFVNSISEGKITADEIRALKAKHPGTSFILVYHTTKVGAFRGSQEHAHLVDVMVQVHDGVAEANGRYGKAATKPTEKEKVQFRKKLDEVISA